MYISIERGLSVVPMTKSHQRSIRLRVDYKWCGSFDIDLRVDIDGHATKSCIYDNSGLGEKT